MAAPHLPEFHSTIGCWRLWSRPVSTAVWYRSCTVNISVRCHAGSASNLPAAGLDRAAAARSCMRQAPMAPASYLVKGGEYMKDAWLHTLIQEAARTAREALQTWPKAVRLYLLLMVMAAAAAVVLATYRR
jgi:hypothetical protein